MKLLYHGSTMEITEIDLSRSKPKDRQQAFEMASYKAIQLDMEPVVNVFEFDEQASASLRTKYFAAYNEEWAEFIFANRNNPSPNTPVHDYDIVYGPIANDRVGLQIRNYMEHNIDLPTFLERLKYMRGITFQYFFGTERAIKLLRKL